MYFIIFIIIIILLIFYKSKTIEKFQNPISIPKIIWTYWNSDDLPDVVNLCIETWRKHNADYKINILTPSNLKEFIDVDVKSIKWNDSPARESDIVRLIVIEKYGGVWCDATVMVTNHFDIDDRYEFIGYYFNGMTSDYNHPIIESWFFASIPNSKFIKNWKAAFFKLDEFNTISDGVEYMKKQGVDLQKMHSHEYLFVYIAAQYVLQKQMTVSEIKRTMLIKKAEDGPFKYVEKNGWDVQKSLENLCNTDENLTGMIKFRIKERNVLIENSELKDCIFAKAL